MFSNWQCNIVFALLVVAINKIHSQNPIVEIEDGRIEGTYMSTRMGVQFAAFRGIRYAESPTGNLRFQVSNLNKNIEI